MDRASETMEEIPAEVACALAFSRDFLESAAHTALRRPYDGLAQLLEQSPAGIHLPKSSWLPRPSNDNLATSAGAFAGTLADFWILHKILGRIPVLGPTCGRTTWQTEAAKTGLTGLIMEAANPLSDTDDFLSKKLTATSKAVATFAAYGAVIGKFNQLGVLGRSGRRDFFGDVMVNACSGAAGGVSGAFVEGLIGHKAASFTDMWREAKHGASFGIGMAGLDHLLISRTRVKLEALKPSPDTYTSPNLSTEQWASTKYDGKIPIRSPILTLLAESNPSLRPPNYETLRKAAWSENPVDLSLGDWKPEQRAAVISELRRLSKTQLSSDANLDALLSNLDRPSLRKLAAEYMAMEKPRRDLELRIEDELAKGPRSLQEKSLLQIAYDPAILETCSPELIELVQQWKKIEFANSQSVDVSNRLNHEYRQVLNQMARQAGLPDFERVFVSGHRSAQYVLNELFLGIDGETGRLTATTAERAVHEFTHHEQGTLSDTTSLMHIVKHPLRVLGARLGISDGPRMLQNPRNRFEFLHDYVGSSKEVGAYSTGLLARIRAMSAGLPDGILAPRAELPSSK